MRRFHHVGVITHERHPGEIYVAETKVHVTNPVDHPYRVEVAVHGQDCLLKPARL